MKIIKKIGRNHNFDRFIYIVPYQNERSKEQLESIPLHINMQFVLAKPNARLNIHVLLALLVVVDRCVGHNLANGKYAKMATKQTFIDWLID